MIAAVVLLLICAPFLWWYLFLQKYKSLSSIPGPQPLPFIGTAHKVGSTPQDLYKNLLKFSKQYGDLFKLYIGNEVKVFLARAEFLEKIMSSNIHITKTNGYELLRPMINDGLLISTGEKWRTRRKMITPSFHFKILEKFLEIFNSSGDILAQKLSHKVGESSFDVYPYINLCTLDVICETAMGVKVASQEGKSKSYVDAIRNYLDIFIVRFFSPWEKFDTLFKLSSKYKLHKHSTEVLQNFSEDVIAKRRSEKSQENIEKASDSVGSKKKVALLDMLLENEHIYNLTNQDIKEEINTFLFEGHDTTTSAINFSLLALADYPNIQEKVYNEIVEVVGEEKYVTMQHLRDTVYLDMVLKEVQRVYPSVPFVERRLETNFNICGIDFPKGTNLILYMYGVHHNEKHFPDPEIFDPNRFLPEKQSERHNYCYVPFSAGPRNCIGQKFAWLELKTTIIKVLQRFQIHSVPNYTPELGMGAILRSYNGIWIRLEQRHK